MDLGNLFIFMLVIAGAAWWWRAHGIRERALLLAKQHCAREGVELLDEAMALQRFRFQRDGRGNLRLAREYAFEFTATGQERYAGSIAMFGQHLGRVELAPFRMEPEPRAPASPVATFHPAAQPVDEEIVDAVFDDAPAPPRPRGEVVRLDEWRRAHQGKKVGD
ncbi:DUF3301 domain-containing protein [Pseudomonas sp. GD04087]|uniref:DUF3301 domain-containing protein n=2 Tax=Pseudomonas TaxID=286 RepID=UPI001F3AB262|nr:MULTISPECIES: DUF3301 domain-containing protein [Pseudomonas]MCP1648333.1 hypothetical protein [Pseudomonas nitroreducens]MCP1686908.1 hypothetical protein [Pseudomonas nitroreducens]MDH0292394.1 DUF3301 domain-containing protein [Pseudomonas sp. GD04087]MDH1050673.1 DUF3301 domain-containing protein [Pseudomonas sp. GD03903]MDH2002511.1 DUF3301 domain-containing protein [Pseudomonas sp. GD03691]